MQVSVILRPFKGKLLKKEAKLNIGRKNTKMNSKMNILIIS